MLETTYLDKDVKREDFRINTIEVALPEGNYIVVHNDAGNVGNLVGDNTMNGTVIGTATVNIDINNQRISKKVIIE
jgi:hypothetical protein